MTRTSLTRGALARALELLGRAPARRPLPPTMPGIPTTYDVIEDAPEDVHARLVEIGERARPLLSEQEWIDRNARRLAVRTVRTFQAWREDLVEISHRDDRDEILAAAESAGFLISLPELVRAIDAR